MSDLSNMLSDWSVIALTDLEKHLAAFGNDELAMMAESLSNEAEQVEGLHPSFANFMRFGAIAANAIVFKRAFHANAARNN